MMICIHADTRLLQKADWISSRTTPVNSAREARIIDRPIVSIEVMRLQPEPLHLRGPAFVGEPQQHLYANSGHQWQIFHGSSPRLIGRDMVSRREPLQQ